LDEEDKIVTRLEQIKSELALWVRATL
jgi:hypothetical protein